MAGKFDHLMPVQVGDIVKEIRAIKKTLVRVGSTAQNAAALAHRAVPITYNPSAAKTGVANFLPATFTDVLSLTLAIPDGAKTLNCTGYASAGSTFSNSTTGGVIGVALDIIIHGASDWRFSVAPAISNGRAGMGGCSAPTFGGGAFPDWLNDPQYAAKTVTFVASAYRSGDAFDSSDNAHIAASCIFYR